MYPELTAGWAQKIKNQEGEDDGVQSSTHSPATFPADFPAPTSSGSRLWVLTFLLLGIFPLLLLDHAKPGLSVLPGRPDGKN